MIKQQTLGRDESGDSCNNLRVGIFLEPEPHIQLALTLWRPMDTVAKISDQLKRAVFRMLTEEPHSLAKERLKILKFYKMRAEQLHQDEAKPHESLPPHVRQVVQGKRLLLLEERLNATAFPDMQVMDGFKAGVDLVGAEPFYHLFTERLQPAPVTVEQLLTAQMNRELVMSRSPTAQELEHADRLVELSQEEVDEHFLAVPFFTEDEVSPHLGTSVWTLTKRFLLLQGEELKERAIDAYKRSLVNASFASRSYLGLQDVDVHSALVTYVMRLVSEGPCIQVELQDGTKLCGVLGFSGAP